MRGGSVGPSAGPPIACLCLDMMLMECQNVPPLILIADDESVIRDVLASLLAEEGYRVHTVSDGAEALDYLVLHRPDVIVSDIKMPRMHGLTLVERIRAEGHEMPVILISTWTPPAGIPGVHFVRKPFDLDQVTDAVKASLPSV